MIPLRDENPARTVPYVTYILVALNVIVFLYNGPLGPHTNNPLSGLVLTPVELTRNTDVGAPTPVPAWMTIYTSMFMHANWLHIFGNMLYLWIFGNNIEDVLGKWKFLAFYLAAGTVAALSQVLIDPYIRIPMVGASGAVAGVLGAYLILFPRARTVTFIAPFYILELPASVVLGFWIVIQILNSLLLGSGMFPRGDGVAYAAHIGGFAAGVVMILFFGGKKLLRGRRPVEFDNRDRWDDVF